MDWEALIKAYPDDTEAILGVKALREKVDAVISRVEIPVIEAPCREMDDFNPFLEVFTTVCLTVWKDMTGSGPSFDMAGVLQAFVADEEIPAIPEDEHGLAESLMNAVISRFLHVLREKNAQLVPEEWSKGTCPFCGAYPKIGFDAEDKRTLACLSCGHVWRFPRIACHVCGTTDHTVLGYFDVEDNEGVRVYFCRSCGNYLKIMDTRVKIVNDPETADALTLMMDSLAEQEGFSSPD